MKLKRNRKHAVILTTILALLMLAGCSSATTEDVKEEVLTTVQAENVEVEKETEVQEVESTEEVVEPQADIPEGIDLESDLPGEEWLKSFSSTVSEPVVVIYNDVTGRKEVIQQDSEIYVNTKEDFIAVCFPEGYSVTQCNGIIRDNTIQTTTYNIYIFNSEKANMMGDQNVDIIVSGKEDWNLQFWLIPEV